MCDYYTNDEYLIHYTYKMFSGDRTDSPQDTPLMAAMCDYYIIVVPLIHYTYETFSRDRTVSFVIAVLKTHHLCHLFFTTLLLLYQLYTIIFKKYSRDITSILV